MHILNFSHPLASEQVDALAQVVGQNVSSLRDIKTHFDVTTPFQGQVVALLDSLDISPNDWQSQAWLIVLPSLNYAAAVMLAELHGRMGHFPAIVRLRPKQGALVTEFEIAEVVNLESIRQTARTRR